MKIEIKYFGLLAEAVGKGKELLDIEPNCTVQQLQELVGERYPKLQQKSFQIAVNQHLAEGTALLSEGDEVALLPPFAGG